MAFIPIGSLFNLLLTHGFYSNLLLHIQSSVHFCIHFSWLMAVTGRIWLQVFAFAKQTESYPSVYATRISVIGMKAFKNSLVNIHSNSPIFSEKSLQQSDFSPQVLSEQQLLCRLLLCCCDRKMSVM